MELMTKKTLFAGLASFALLMGTVGTAGADGPEGKIEVKEITVGDTEVEFGHDSIGHKNAVSVNALQQVSSNIASVIGVHDNELVSGSAAHDGMVFGHSTFENQVLDVNNFALGINQAQQGAVSIAVQGTFGDTNDD